MTFNRLSKERVYRGIRGYISMYGYTGCRALSIRVYTGVYWDVLVQGLGSRVHALWFKSKA